MTDLEVAMNHCLTDIVELLQAEPPLIQDAIRFAENGHKAYMKKFGEQIIREQKGKTQTQEDSNA